jgi:hypothetical protein
VLNKVTLPIYYLQEFKTKPSKNILVGLNWERNAHYFIKSEVKRHYHQLVADQVPTSNIPLEKFEVEIKLFYKTPTCDPWNIISMIMKYLLDGLQECDVLTNDNVKFDCGGSILPPEQDKLNPRVEVTIRSYDE